MVCWHRNIVLIRKCKGWVMGRHCLSEAKGHKQVLSVLPDLDSNMCGGHSLLQQSRQEQDKTALQLHPTVLLNLCY
jgi:peroxiredoxin